MGFRGRTKRINVSGRTYPGAEPSVRETPRRGRDSHFEPREQPEPGLSQGHHPATGWLAHGRHAQASRRALESQMEASVIREAVGAGEGWRLCSRKMHMAVSDARLEPERPEVRKARATTSLHPLSLLCSLRGTAPLPSHQHCLCQGPAGGPQGDRGLRMEA